MVDGQGVKGLEDGLEVRPEARGGREGALARIQDLYIADIGVGREGVGGEEGRGGVGVEKEHPNSTWSWVMGSDYDYD